MGAWKRQTGRLVLAAWLSAAAGVLGACGGGGGGNSAAPSDPGALYLDRTAVSVSARLGDAAPVVNLVLTSQNATSSTLYASATGTQVGLLNTGITFGTTQAQITLQFRSPALMTAGTYTDTVTVTLCYDTRCDRHLIGSPAQVPVTYTVQPPSLDEPGVTLLDVASSTDLPHNVVDAAFSRSLNAVVMVASWPEPLLVIRDAASGAMQQVRLNKPPLSVSVSPDGRKAAVGHDALVTVVDLVNPAAAPKLLNVAAVAGSVVLDGRGVVHVFPKVDQWVAVHSVDVATNTERSGMPIYAGAVARGAPDGTTLFALETGLSPAHVQRVDVSGGTAVKLRESPYHGPYDLCGNLWLSEDAGMIYSACGNTFRTSLTPELDMLYSGALTVGNNSTALYGWRITSLSHSASRREIAVLEQPWYECWPMNNGQGCFSHLSLYESDFLARRALYGLRSVTVAGTAYAQRGLFVFHRADGAKLLLTRLFAMPNPAAEFRISVVP